MLVGLMSPTVQNMFFSLKLKITKPGYLPSLKCKKQYWVEIINYATKDTLSCFVQKGNAEIYFVFENGLL